MGFTNYKPIKPIRYCTSKEHNPPGMIGLSPGIHTWTCPDCGQSQKIFVPEKPMCSLPPWDGIDYRSKRYGHVEKY